MKKIVNPYAKDTSGEYHCFGCSPSNPIGLKMHFHEVEEGEVMSKWIPEKKYEGYLNVLHGGIQATMLDEIASWVVYTQCGTAGVTASMEVKYQQPVLIDKGEITLKAKLVDQNRRLATIHAQIINHEGKVGSEGTIRYFLFPVEKAKESMNYPGKEAFFEHEEK